MEIKTQQLEIRFNTQKIHFTPEQKSPRNCAVTWFSLDKWAKFLLTAGTVNFVEAQNVEIDNKYKWELWHAKIIANRHQQIYRDIHKNLDSC